MSEYVIRRARPDDRAQIIALWGEVFGDGEDFVSPFLSRLAPPESCRVAGRDGVVAAMGFCLTGARAGAYSCGYIYAMATLPEHRGRGLAAAIGRSLVEGAFASGVDIVATLPAEESLNAWYETRLGMAPAFKKGGEGVEFPESWRRFAAEYCPEHDPGTPGTLLAAAREGVDLHAVRGLGWELTLD